jgi:hypothetical protein
MELVSPAYRSRYCKDHGEWWGQRREPCEPRAREAWLKHRELAWDSSARRYTPQCVGGIKPMTYEPWSDETIAVDAAWSRIGGSTRDLQGQVLRGAMSYSADVLSRRHLKWVLRQRGDKRDMALYFNSLAT